jgi:hypothetical protein
LSRFDYGRNRRVPRSNDQEWFDVLVADETWGSDDRAAARAFLQRVEVRLGTVHRVATALLSGAGLMVLPPAIARDAITSVLRSLITADQSLVHGLLIGATLVVLTLPLVGFVYLLRDLTNFYFHGQHFETSVGQVFTPRFTLTGLRLPSETLLSLDGLRRRLSCWCPARTADASTSIANLTHTEVLVETQPAEIWRGRMRCSSWLPRVNGPWPKR